MLAVDDDPDILQWLQADLTRRGYGVACCASGADALERLAAQPADVVLTDLDLGGMDGIELCSRIVADWPDVPVILLTAHGTVAAAVAAIRAGAFDFMAKPLAEEPLAFVVERALRHRRLRDEVHSLRSEADKNRVAGDVLGRSPVMRRVVAFIDQVASVGTSVLITGESGTGKEVVARELHGRGDRRRGPFVAINCAALPEALLESELFGHARGAFTGAQGARRGLFASASGGTLFLDEIGELPLSLQPKLLRALQERHVRPLGTNQEIGFDTRVIAATNRNLEIAVEAGTFRADLYYRLNVLLIQLPPLRARGNDVLILAQGFVERFAHEMNRKVTGISAEVAEALLAYDWPGNVRELQNAIERAVALARGELVVSADLPDRIRDSRAAPVVFTASDPAALPSLAEVERRYIGRVLEAVNGSKTEAAHILGIGRKTLYRKLQAHSDAGGEPGEEVARGPSGRRQTLHGQGGHRFRPS